MVILDIIAILICAITLFTLYRFGYKINKEKESNKK